MVLKYNNDDGSSFVFLCSYSRHYILVCGIEIFLHLKPVLLQGFDLVPGAFILLLHF